MPARRGTLLPGVITRRTSPRGLGRICRLPLAARISGSRGLAGRSIGGTPLQERRRLPIACRCRLGRLLRNRFGSHRRLLLPDRLRIRLTVARNLLAIAVLVEAGAEAIIATVPRPEILLVLILRRTVEFLGRTVTIGIGLRRAMNRALDDCGLQVVAIALAGILAVFVVIAIFAIRTSALLLKLLVVSLCGRKNAEVMFRVLEIAFRHYDIPGCHRIAAKLEIFVGDSLGGATNLYIRPVAFIDTVERIAAPTSTSTSAATSATRVTTITVTPALFMLPWSHTILILLSELMTG